MLRNLTNDHNVYVYCCSHLFGRTHERRTDVGAMPRSTRTWRLSKMIIIVRCVYQRVWTQRATMFIRSNKTGLPEMSRSVQTYSSHSASHHMPYDLGKLWRTNIMRTVAHHRFFLEIDRIVVRINGVRCRCRFPLARVNIIFLGFTNRWYKMILVLLLLIWQHASLGRQGARFFNLWSCVRAPQRVQCPARPYAEPACIHTSNGSVSRLTLTFGALTLHTRMYRDTSLPRSPCERMQMHMWVIVQVAGLSEICFNIMNVVLDNARARELVIFMCACLVVIKEMRIQNLFSNAIGIHLLHCLSRRMVMASDANESNIPRCNSNVFGSSFATIVSIIFMLCLPCSPARPPYVASVASPFVVAISGTNLQYSPITQPSTTTSCQTRWRFDTPANHCATVSW